MLPLERVTEAIAPTSRRSVVDRYLVALVATAIAVLVRILLAPMAGAHHFPMIAFYAAVVLSAWYGGLLPGLLATALSTASVMVFWMRAATRAGAPTSTQVLGVISFVCVGVVVSVLVESLYRIVRKHHRARAHAERMLDVHHRLQSVTTALADSLTMEEVCDTIVHHAFVILGANAGSVVLLDESGERLTTVRTSGPSYEISDSWAEYPLTASVPVADAVRSGQPLVLSSQEARRLRYPHLLRDDPGETFGALVALPLLLDRRAIGGLSVGFEDDKSFEREDLSLLRMLAQQCAQALERARLYEAERTARSEAEQAIRGFRLLSDAGAVLGSHSDLGAALSALTRHIVPALGDYCLVDLEQSDGSFLRISSNSRDPRSDLLLSELGERYSLSDEPRQFEGHVMAAGRTLVLDDIDEDVVRQHTANPRVATILCELGLRSALIVPIATQNGTLGVLSLGSKEPHRYGPSEQALAEELGRRIAMAAEHSTLYDEARNAMQAREDLLSIVSHDLRNPLSVIMVNASLIGRYLSQGAPSELIANCATTMTRATLRMDDLVRDLRDATNIESHRFSIEPRLCMVDSVLTEAIESTEASAAQKSIIIEKDLDDEPIAIRCDRERILQLVRNLLANAIRHTPEWGRVLLRAEASENELRISVVDSGPLVEPQDVPFIFDRHWKGHRDSGLSAGLGLYIAKGIVDAHQGSIWIEPGLSRGCTFWVSLPRNTAYQSAFPEVEIDCAGDRRLG